MKKFLNKKNIQFIYNILIILRNIIFKLSKVKGQRLNVSSGFTVITTILIIGVAALIMGYSASLLGLGELEMGYSSSRGSEAFYLADGCMEETLRRLKIDSGYLGEVLNLGDGSCTITVVPSGGNRTITVTGSIFEYHKTIEVNLVLSGSDIVITSWEEISS